MMNSKIKDTGYPFELESIMTYCSDCGSKDPKVPVAVLKNGETFGDGIRLTSTDALQLQNKYCHTEQNKEMD